VRGPGLRRLRQTVAAQGHAASARHDQRVDLPGARRGINGTQYAETRSRSKHVRKPRCARHRSGRARGGPRAQGPEGTLRGPFTRWASRAGKCRCSGRLPKSGFNSMTREDTGKCCLSDLERVKAEKSTSRCERSRRRSRPAKRAKVSSPASSRANDPRRCRGEQGARAAAIEAAGGSTDAPIPQPKRNASPRPYRRPSRRRKPKSGKGSPALKSVR